MLFFLSSKLFFFAPQTAKRNGCECLSVCLHYFVLLNRLKKKGGGEGVVNRRRMKWQLILPGASRETLEGGRWGGGVLMSSNASFFLLPRYLLAHTVLPA